MLSVTVGKIVPNGAQNVRSIDYLHNAEKCFTKLSIRTSVVYLLFEISVGRRVRGEGGLSG